VLFAALVIVVDSIVSLRGWWHCCRNALPPNDDNGDLPFPLFFFQIDRRSQLILEGTAPSFYTFLNDKKTTSMTNEMGIYNFLVNLLKTTEMTCYQMDQEDYTYIQEGDPTIKHFCGLNL
jgi:hypothetical protein